MAENPRIYGYDFKSTQPCAIVNLRCTQATGFSPVNVDKWLTRYLLVKDEQIEAAANLKTRFGQPETEALINRAFLLYSSLLQVGKVPIIDTGRLLRLAPDEGEPGMFMATIALPMLDDYAVAPLFAVFRQCLSFTADTLTADPDRVDAEDVIATIDEKVVQRFDQGGYFHLSSFFIFQFALQAGVPFRHLGQGVIRLGQGVNSHKQHSSATDGDSAIGSSICHNKALTAKVLRAAGLPAPVNRRVGSIEDAIEMANEIGWPVVVKPTDQERSIGVTIGIENEEQLRAGYEEAQKHSADIIVEKHVEGFSHRIMTSRGELIYATARRPKSVVGNGKDTIEQLIAAENEARMSEPFWLRKKPFPMDDNVREVLAGQGLDPQSIPEEGRYVHLRTIPNEADGGTIINMTDKIHPDNVKLACDAAAAIGLEISGMDLLTTDISKPWHESGAVIGEMNFRPQFVAAWREDDAKRIIPSMVKNNGRIPVHLVTGDGDVLEAAKQLRKARGCFMTTADYSEDPDGNEIIMATEGQIGRGVALSCRPDVAELVIAGKWPDDFGRGFAVDRFDVVRIVSDNAETVADIEDQLLSRTTINKIEYPNARPSRVKASQPAA